MRGGDREGAKNISSMVYHPSAQSQKGGCGGSCYGKPSRTCSRHPAVGHSRGKPGIRKSDAFPMLKSPEMLGF